MRDLGYGDRRSKRPKGWVLLELAKRRGLVFGIFKIGDQMTATRGRDAQGEVAKYPRL